MSHVDKNYKKAKAAIKDIDEKYRRYEELRDDINQQMDILDDTLAEAKDPQTYSYCYECRGLFSDSHIEKKPTCKRCGELTISLREALQKYLEEREPYDDMSDHLRARREDILETLTEEQVVRLEDDLLEERHGIEYDELVF